MEAARINDKNSDPRLGAENLAFNCRHWMSNEFSGISPSETSSTWAQLYLAVHGTTTERFASILASGALYSYRNLQDRDPAVTADRQTVLTDDLDLQLGLDQYVFLNLGRVHPLDVHEVYLCFPNKIVSTPGTVVALREIVHFGAKVSPEAQLLHMTRERLDHRAMHRQNANAAEEFFKNVFSAKDFTYSIFPSFLQKHFTVPAKYVGQMTYPGTSPEIDRYGDVATIKNVWEGPQVMVPGSISIEDSKPLVIVATRNAYKMDQVKRAVSGLLEVISADDIIKEYKSLSAGGGSYDSPIDTFRYLNLALRDNALRSKYNIFQESFPDSMNGFKSRV